MSQRQTAYLLIERLKELSDSNDPLEKLYAVVDWKIFHPLIKRAFNKPKKSNAGRKPFNRLMMFRILILGALYNLSDEQLAYQIKDRLSFMRFLNVDLTDALPDAKTIWHYRETLIKAGVVDKLFDRFNAYLNAQGFKASLGTIVDASIVEVPKQRNSREDNAMIKSGETPESFKENPHMLRQKDMDARWTRRHGARYFGYKDHIAIDTKHKLIRSYLVSHAAAADIHFLEPLLDKAKPEDKRVWADGAYYSKAQETSLETSGYQSRIVNRRAGKQPQSSVLKQMNRRYSKIRARVEHIFGFMKNSMAGKFIRTVGIRRAKAKIALLQSKCRLKITHFQRPP